jgi:endonuclease YncB( thermonuclease family)
LDPRDTNSYKGDARIRFLMVDTPETDKPGVVGQPYANVATNFTRTLLGEASEIYLQADRNAGLIETYGRTLGLIWFKLDNPVTFNNIAKSGNVVISEGWHLLNYELLKYGLGISGIGKTGEYYNSPIFGNRYLYQWGQEAVWYAEANEYGLYSGVSRN